MSNLKKWSAGGLMLAALVGCSAGSEELKPMKESPKPADPEDIKKGIAESMKYMGGKGQEGAKASTGAETTEKPADEAGKEKMEKEKEEAAAKAEEGK